MGIRVRGDGNQGPSSLEIAGRRLRHGLATLNCLVVSLVGTWHEDAETNLKQV